MTKKILIIMIMFLCMGTCMCEKICAYSNDENVESDKLQGLSYRPPSYKNIKIISFYGVDIPSDNLFYTNNVYQEISGTANVSYLYTDKCFNNVYRINAQITNNSNTVLTVTLCYRRGNEYNYSELKKQSIPDNSTKTLYFLDLNTQRKYFFQFSAPSDFTGRLLGFSSDN